MKVSLSIVLVACLVATFGATAQAQFGDPFMPAVGPAPRQEGPADDEADTSAETVRVDRELKSLGPQEIRLTMLDGSMMTGQLDRSEVLFHTDFGELTVPIERIRRFRPGLRSYPATHKRINDLITALGGDEFKQREEAHKILAGMGIKVLTILEGADDEGNAERRRHLDQIVKELNEQLDQFDPLLGEEADEPMILDDLIETDRFTAIGRLEVDSFLMTSPYGKLTIQMADIANADRLFGGAEPVNVGVSVDGANLAGRKFKSTGLRVEAGDRISIVATGSLTMSPWGSNQVANPDGNSYFGMYNAFPGGQLIGKVGDDGSEFSLGSSKTWIADRAGVLKLGIAMQSGYVGEGYNFPGGYKVRLKVVPKAR